MSWPAFALVFAAFFVTHSVPTRPRVKDRLVQTLGPRGFTIAYSTLSLFMLWAVLFAAGRAPYVMLWPQSPWQYEVTHLAMLAACMILALAIGRPNPFSFGGAHNDRFDPDHPGIIRYTRHPLLLALALWAGCHIVPNGNLAHVIVFGAFAAFALAGMALIDRRKRRIMGADGWHALRRAVANGPRLPRPRRATRTLLRAGIGLAAFALLVVLHTPLIGVSPLS